MLVTNTIKAAPRRDSNFCLNRQAFRIPNRAEACLEQAMWEKWGPTGAGEIYLPCCPYLQTYQFPLKRSSGDRGWGQVDLLGVGRDHLPVVNEVKSRESRDTPLRMLVEMTAYGLAIREGWTQLKADWETAMNGRFGKQIVLPDKLLRMTLIGIAPEEYWDRFRGKSPKDWSSYWRLVDALTADFDICFAVVDGSWNDPLPQVTGARVLNLRELTSYR